MSRRLYLVLVTLLASGLIAVGCGDDDDDGGGSDEPAQTQEDTGGTGDAGGGGGGTGDVPDNIEEAVEQCKQAVTSAPQLSADTKGKLEEQCEAAADGDEEAVREAQKEVCRLIIEDTIPAGPGRETALASCDQAGETP